MKKALKVLGTLAAVAALVMGVVGTNLDAAGNPQDAHPLGAVAIGVAAFALLKASEYWD